MELKNLAMSRLLPGPLKGDEAAAGLARAADTLLREAATRLPLLRKWDQIDAMGHEGLDELAWELNVLWYDPAASLEAKRRLIGTSDLVHARLGTRWAVEEIAMAYLGAGARLEEWFEYGGSPHYFRIRFQDPDVSLEDQARFFRALNMVKRKSQWLEGIRRQSHIHKTVWAAGTNAARVTGHLPPEAGPGRINHGAARVAGCQYTRIISAVGGADNYG